MSSRPVTILEHQLHWHSDFEVISSELRRVLGSIALRLDHIGSTAIPHLCAKDVIDVQVTVRTLGRDISEKLVAAGFTTHSDVSQDHIPPGFDSEEASWNKLFFMERAGARRCNIHIRQLGSPNQRYALLVRDFLLADKRTAEAYGELKKRLAGALADPESYPHVKDPAADIIYFAAERWAAQTNWRQLS